MKNELTWLESLLMMAVVFPAAMVVLGIAVLALLVAVVVMVVAIPIAALTGTLKVVVKDAQGKEKEMLWPEFKDRLHRNDW